MIFYFYKFYLVLPTLPVLLVLIPSLFFLILISNTILLHSLWDFSIIVLFEVHEF